MSDTIEKLGIFAISGLPRMVHKCETTVLGNGGMEFHETFTKR